MDIGNDNVLVEVEARLLTEGHLWCNAKKAAMFCWLRICI